jgi:hypothetical protein
VIIVIDLAGRSVTLAQPDDFGAFSVQVLGDAEEGALPAVVSETHLGRMAPDGMHVVVDPVTVRALAGTSVDDGWDAGFGAMCAYAAGKGWIEADGGILAHIEPGEG